MPSSTEEWEHIAIKYDQLWNYPKCIGSLNGKHVVNSAPPNSGSVFYNYKYTHSIVLMAIADAEYKLLYIDVGSNGCNSDGGIFNKCSFGIALEEKKLNLLEPKPLPGRQKAVPYLIVADDAFALKPNLLKPYSARELSGLQRIFNYRLSRARRTIKMFLASCQHDLEFLGDQ